MKDRVALILTGLTCAAGAHVFWSYLGQNAFDVFATFVMIALFLDNFQMRRRLRRAGLADTSLRE